MADAPLSRHQADRELLERFIERREEEAFAALVRRHGPLVLGVCRRILKNGDVEDVFQATFLMRHEGRDQAQQQAPIIILQNHHLQKALDSRQCRKIISETPSRLEKTAFGQHMIWPGRSLADFALLDNLDCQKTRNFKSGALGWCGADSCTVI